MYVEKNPARIFVFISSVVYLGLCGAAFFLFWQTQLQLPRGLFGNYSNCNHHHIYTNNHLLLFAFLGESRFYYDGSKKPTTTAFIDSRDFIANFNSEKHYYRLFSSFILFFPRKFYQYFLGICFFVYKV